MYKQFITSILVLLPLMAFCQSSESNKLYMQGLKLFDAKRYEAAIPFFQKSDSIDKATLPPTSKDIYRAELKLADCMSGVVDSLLGAANYAETIKLQTAIVKIRKKALGEYDTSYFNAFGNLALYYDYNGNYAEAIEIGTKVVEICKIIYGDNHPEYATILHNLALANYHSGNYTTAITLEESVVKIWGESLGIDHPNYAVALDFLASYYSEVGNYTEAIRLETIAIEINKKVFGENSLEYASSLEGLAAVNSDVGKITESIRLLDIAREIYKNKLGEDNLSYAILLSNIAYYNYLLGDNAEAVRLGAIAVEIKKKYLGEHHPDYNLSLHNLATYYFQNGNYRDAIKLETIVMENYGNVLGTRHNLYAQSANNLAVYNQKIGNYTEAIRLIAVARDIWRETFGEGHLSYALSLWNSSVGYFLAENYSEAVKNYKQAYANTSSFFLKNFSVMTSNERSNLWNRYSKYIYMLPFVAFKINAPDLTALAYNAQVFSKGILLNAELEIQKLIEQSHDTTFANSYYKIKSDRALLDELYQFAPDERPMDADSLLKVIDNEERLLVQSSKELGDYTKNLSVDWQNIQKRLKGKDLAVEFSSFKDTSNGLLIYVAFVLKKKMKAPELVKLFEFDEFYDVKSADYYKTPKFYNLVWKPLSKYLNGVKNVYFSPTGRLHTIGIEYLPDEDGKIFAEKYNAYRLSSTRELALEKEINPNNKAATYGGIKYDSDSDSINAEQRSVSISYLDGTRVESAAVANLLRTAQYSVTALSDTLATEESFKKLSGNNLKILHIGTHGFYFSEADMENAGYKFFTSSQQSDEDKALSCSGLLFAGANAALDLKNRSVIPEGDDGVLTAKEISRLDFKGLDLVVLSACQTGLGEVKGEGVFGLQRGFKKAGAQTIVMSLWKVFDDSTQLLMTEFFKNLTAGQSKRAAFQAAQKTVRAKYPDPQHWAAFVMVDGL